MFAKAGLLKEFQTRYESFVDSSEIENNIEPETIQTDDNRFEALAGRIVLELLKFGIPVNSQLWSMQPTDSIFRFVNDIPWILRVNNTATREKIVTLVRHAKRGGRCLG